MSAASSAIAQMSKSFKEMRNRYSQGCETGKRTTFWAQFSWVFTMRLHKQSQFDFSRIVSKIKIVNFDKKLKSVINFKLVASVGLTLLTFYNLCHILRSHPQKSIFRKIRKSCQKLSESYPNCMLCMSAFFTSKDVKIESRTADLWAHTRCMHDLAFPFKK